MPKDPLSVEFNTEELEKAISKYPGFLDRMLELTSFALLGEIQKEAPTKSGLLAGSYQQAKLGALSYVVGSNVLYRWFVEGGTRPHEIEARTAKALYFYFAKMGGWVFFKRVQHPGTEANPFITRALDTTAGLLEGLAEKAIEEKMLPT